MDGFKIGDRVRRLPNKPPHAGMVGTVVGYSDNTYVHVTFDPGQSQPDQGIGIKNIGCFPRNIGHWFDEEPEDYSVDE